MSRLTKAQSALLSKAAAADDGIVFPFHAEWHAAYALARLRLIAVRNIPGKSQHYIITDLGRSALSEHESTEQ